MTAPVLPRCAHASRGATLGSSKTKKARGGHEARSTRRACAVETGARGKTRSAHLGRQRMDKCVRAVALCSERLDSTLDSAITIITLARHIEFCITVPIFQPSKRQPVARRVRYYAHHTLSPPGLSLKYHTARGPWPACALSVIRTLHLYCHISMYRRVYVCNQSSGGARQREPHSMPAAHAPSGAKDGDECVVAESVPRHNIGVMIQHVPGHHRALLDVIQPILQLAQRLTF